MAKIIVKKTEITVVNHSDRDYISLTYMANDKQDETHHKDYKNNN